MNGKFAIAFNISRTYALLRRGKGDRADLYDCVRHYWVAKKERAEGAYYAFGVVNGEVICVYRPARWYCAKAGKHKGRLEFDGEAIEDSPYIGMDLAACFRTARNPVRYIRL